MYLFLQDGIISQINYLSILLIQQYQKFKITITETMYQSKINSIINQLWAHKYPLTQPAPSYPKNKQPIIPDHRLQQQSKSIVWERLLTDKRQFYQKNRVQKIHNQQIKDTTKPSSICNKNININTTQRLYNQALQISKVKQEIFSQARKNVQFYSFRPQISQKSASMKERQKPIFQRIEQILDQKVQEMIRIRINREEQQNLKFKPEINSKSQQYFKNANFSKNVVQRLVQQAQQKLEKKLKNIQHRQKQIVNEFSFKPQLNYHELFKEVPKVNFLQSMSKETNGNNEKIEFKPQICQLSEYLIQANPKRAQQSVSQKFQRLTSDNKRKDEKVKKIQNQIYGQYSFIPKIDPISKSIAKKNNTDLLCSREKQAKLTRIRQEIQEQEMKECYFHPLINQRSRKYTRNSSFQDIKQSRKVDQIRQQLEYKQLKECKFQPQINRNVNIVRKHQLVDENGLGQIKGIENHLRNMQRIKRRQEQQKQKQNEVFNLQGKYDAQMNRQKKTSPIPFNLSKCNPTQLIQLKQQLLQQQKRQCPFKPQI